MLKQTIKYHDFDGEEREEDFYFNLTEAEMLDLQTSTEGGLDQVIEKILKEKKSEKLYEYFTHFVKVSYGQKSPDGRRFIKSPELTKEFLETNAYSVFLLELLTKENAAVEFINGIMPKGLMDKVSDAKLPQGVAVPQDYKPKRGSE